MDILPKQSIFFPNRPIENMIGLRLGAPQNFLENQVPSNLR